MKERITIRGLLLTAFGLILVMFLGVIVASMVHVVKLEAVAKRIESIHTPTSEAGMTIVIHINGALSALRGWMLLHEIEYDRRLQVAWQGIRRREKELVDLSARWTNPENTVRFKKIRALLHEFEQRQIEIRKISASPENEPATHVLVSEVIPLAASMGKIITALIDHEKTVPFSPARRLHLIALVDYRGTLGFSLAAMRAYLLTGEDRFQREFEIFWGRNQESFGRVRTSVKTLDAYESTLLQNLTEARARFAPLPARMFELRGKENWNQANFLLKTRAAPTARKLVEALNEMVEDQRHLHEAEIHKMAEQTAHFKLILAGLSFAALGGMAGLGLTIRRKAARLKEEIAERRKTEDELGTSQTLLRTVFDTVPHTLWVKNRDGQYVLVNQTFAERYSLKPEEFTNLSALEAKTGADLNSANSMASDRRVFEAGEKVEIPAAVATMADGEKRIRHIIKLPIRDEQGQVTGLVGISEEITARIKAEEELRASQMLLRTAFDLFPHRAYVKDINSRYLIVNRKLAETYGLSVAEMEGLHTLEIAGRPTEEKQHVVELDRQALEGKTDRLETEVVMRLPDGSEKVFEATKAPFRDQDGAVVGLVGMSVDITARKEREEALRRSEENYRQLVEGSIQGFVIAKNREIVLANQAFADMLGYESPSQLIGLHSSEYVAPEDQERLAAYAWERSRGGSAPDQYEFRALHRDGNLVWLERRTQRVEWEGEPTTWSVAIDITERKQAEADLLASQELLRTVIDTIPHRLAVLGKNGEWLLANAAVRRLWPDIPPDELPPDGVAPHLAREEQAIALDYRRRVIEEGQSLDYERQHDLSDGTKEWISVRWVPFHDARGRIAGSVMVATDITERVILEQQLRQAQKMEAVGQLAGGVAHDFNNMLQIVRGYSSLALDRVEQPEKVTGYLKLVLTATENASSLTQQLLAFSRQQTLHRQPVDFNELIATQVGMLRRLIRQDVELVFVPAPDGAVVEADAGMLEQVIINMALNARDAMPDGGQLTLKLSHRKADPAFCRTHGWACPIDYVMLQVSDSGAGMDPAVRDRVFEPFFTTKEVGKGTGLGLAMVYGIMQQHDGMISVYSEPGLGTTFTLYLPQHVSPAIPQGTASGEETRGGKETILLAEDEEAVRMLVEVLLADAGYNVLSARDGVEALEKFTADPDSIDLVLLDMIMPGKNGRQVYEEVRALRPNVPVLFSTGYAGDSEDSDFITKNDLPVVRKPYNPSELYLALRDALA